MKKFRKKKKTGIKSLLHSCSHDNRLTEGKMESGFVPRQRNSALLFLVHVGITFTKNVALTYRKGKMIASSHRVMAKTFPLNAFSAH